MTDLHAILAAVLCSPDDDTPRTVYADCFEEVVAGAAGAVRKAFIFCQVELARLPPMPPKVGVWFHGPEADRQHCFRVSVPFAAWREAMAKVPDDRPDGRPRVLGETLVHFNSSNAAGGEINFWGFVLNMEQNVLDSTSTLIVRAVERPDWCVKRYELEREEEALYRAGGAVCWPMTAEEEARLQPPAGQTRAGELLQQAFAARFQREGEDRDDALTHAVEAAVRREMLRAGRLETPQGFLREAAALYEGAVMRPWSPADLPRGVVRNGDFVLIGSGAGLAGVRFARGFVEEVRCDEAAFLRDCGRWFSHAPVRKVHLTDKNPFHTETSAGEGVTGWQLGSARGPRAGNQLHPALFNDLDLEILDPNFKGVRGGGSAQFQACRRSLERSCRRLGRFNARGFWQRTDPCPACRGAGCKQHRHQHGLRRLRCDGSGEVRSAGLPYYAGDE